jgi:hypothetical protein
LATSAPTLGSGAGAKSQGSTLRSWICSGRCDGARKAVGRQMNYRASSRRSATVPDPICPRGIRSLTDDFETGTASTIFAHYLGCATFERGGARSADSFGRHKPDQPVAALTDGADALALDVLKERPLLRAVDLPEAEVVLVTGGHMSVPPAQAQRSCASPSGRQGSTTAVRAQ